MPIPTPIEFLDYTPALAPHFKRINEAWIRAMFAIEPTDLDALDNPEETIINPGGQIIFASHAGHKDPSVLGVCALKPVAFDANGTVLDSGTFELTKMGVDSTARGLKVGETLLAYVLEVAANTPAIKRLFLLTSHKCEAAIHLYEKRGFVHDQEIMGSFGAAYERCSVAMKYPDIWDA